MFRDLTRPKASFDVVYFSSISGVLKLKKSHKTSWQKGIAARRVWHATLVYHQESGVVVVVVVYSSFYLSARAYMMFIGIMK